MNERERCPPRNGVICTQFFFDRHVHLEDYSFITTPAFVTSLLLKGLVVPFKGCRSRKNGVYIRPAENQKLPRAKLNFVEFSAEISLSFFCA